MGIINHMHIYPIKWIQLANQSILQGSPTTCPLGHANCQVTPTGSKSILHFDVQGEATSGCGEDAEIDHTHDYYQMNVLTTENIEYIAAFTGSPRCSSNEPLFQIKSATIPASVEENLVATSNTLWLNYTCHYHTYEAYSDMYINAIASLKNCSLGHTNCDRSSWGGGYFPDKVTGLLVLNTDYNYQITKPNDMIYTDHVIEINKLIEHTHPGFTEGGMITGNDVDHGDRVSMDKGWWHYHEGKEVKVYMDRYIGNWPGHCDIQHDPAYQEGL